MKQQFMIIILGMCSALAGTGHAKDLPLQQIEADCSLDVDYPMPHTTWAKPYDGVPIRFLYLASFNAGVNTGSTRQAVEILQRFDMTADVVLLQGNAIYGGQTGEQRLRRLLETPYDCYVIGSGSLAAIGEAQRATMIEHVRQGAGMVFMRHLTEEDASLLDGVEELADLPEMVAGMDIEACTLGRGRVAGYVGRSWNLNAAGPKDRIFGVYLLRDLRTETDGRAILWAAGRKPGVDVSISLPGHTLVRRDLPGSSVTIQWRGSNVDTPLTLRTSVLSQSRGGRELRVRGDLDPAAGSVRFAMPVLPAGTYWLHAEVASDKGVVGWQVKPFEVTAADRPDNVALTRAWGEAGEPIEGTVDVRTADSGGRTLRVQAIDRYGRVLSRRDFPKPADNVSFALPTESWMPNYLGVEAVLLEADDAVAYAYAPSAYTIPKRNRDTWNWVMWGRHYANDVLDIIDEMLAHSGVTSRIETTSKPWWQMTRAGMSYVPYCQSGLQLQKFQDGRRVPSIDLDEDGVLKKGCWNDEPAVTERLTKWLGDENDYRQHGVLVYSMGDERNTRGSCLHPACMKAYQAYLVKQYGTIEALNASWGTGFSTFTDIDLSAPGDNLEDEAFRQKNTARWFDRRAFQAWNFARYCRRFGEAARQIDPRALSGAEGTGWLDDDLDLIVRHTAWWILYSIPAAEVVRSVAPRGYLLGHWIGYSTTNPKYPVSDFWLSFLRGANCMGYWRSDNFLGPHLGPSVHGGKDVAQTGRIVFDGLGTLLNLKSQMQHDGVAMLHSFAAAQATNIGPGLSYGTYNGWITNSEAESKYGMDWAVKPGGKNHFAWHRAIRAVGLQFEYVTDRMMRLGEFDPGRFKVLILSQHEAIGAAEADAIRRFAQSGGTVIADIRPGLYNEHCKPLEGGALDDLFGVRHTGNVPAVAVPGRILGAIGGREVAVEVLDMQVNPAVELTTGRALGHAGETPICIVNKVGDGRAILLNFPMCSFSNLSRPETPEADADLLAEIFASAGVTWPLRLLDAEGRRKRNLESVRWKTGEATEVVAVYGPLDDGRSQWRPDEGLLDRIRALDVPSPVHIRLPDARHVTVLESNDELGRTDAFTIHTRPWRPVFVVLSSQPMQDPVLEPDTQTTAPGRTLEFGVRIPDPQGLHALKVRVRGPDGAAAPWFDQTVFVGQQAAELSLPIAHNEQPGTWTVEAEDLFNGRKAIARFEVHQEKAGLLARTGPERTAGDWLRSPGGQDVLDQPPLHVAIRQGQVGVIERLIGEGADVNARDRWGWSALCAAVDADRRDAAAQLIAAGADVNAPSKDGWTALNLAAMLGRLDLVKLLLAKGADIQAANRREATPLHSAVSKQHRQVMLLLLAAGARPDARDAKGKTPQGMAEQYGLDWKMAFRDKTGVLPQTWVFRKDPQKKGQRENWHLAPISDKGWHPISTQTFWTHQDNPGRWYGTGWYRIDFTVEELGIDPQRVSAAKKVRITFGAIDGYPKVWLNGKLLAERDDNVANVWDKPLSVDVTGVIKADGINQLAVSCTKKSDAAGIHAGKDEQPVRLVVE